MILGTGYWEYDEFLGRETGPLAGFRVTSTSFGRDVIRKRPRLNPGPLGKYQYLPPTPKISKKGAPPLKVGSLESEFRGDWKTPTVRAKIPSPAHGTLEIYKTW